MCMWRWTRAARRWGGGAALGALAAIRPAGLAAQTAAAELAVRFAGWTAVAGFEQAATDSLLALLPGSARDRAGNVVVTLGRGAPRRLASCAVDEPGYVVGAVTDDGYLRLRRVPGAAPAPLFDQALEGQRVTLVGDAGPVPGVVAVRSVHLARFRAAAEAPFTVDDAFVDVGAASRAEAERLGLRVLTPVALAKRPHRYGDGLLAAPVAALLARPQPRGTVVAAFTVQSRYANTGLRAVEALAGPFAEERQAALAVRYGGTPVETVSLAAADSLAR